MYALSTGCGKLLLIRKKFDFRWWNPWAMVWIICGFRCSFVDSRNGPDRLWGQWFSTRLSTRYQQLFNRFINTPFCLHPEMEEGKKESFPYGMVWWCIFTTLFRVLPVFSLASRGRNRMNPGEKSKRDGCCSDVLWEVFHQSFLIVWWSSRYFHHKSRSVFGQKCKFVAVVCKYASTHKL